MAKIGRNQPCPCGSGKKHKRCCLGKGSVMRGEAAPRVPPPGALAPPGFFFGEADIDKLSNSVVDLIDDGRFDEAQVVCQELKEQYPDVIDWLFRTAMLHEARGQTQQAIHYYERTVQYIDENPDGFDASSRESWLEDIERLRRVPDASS